VRDESSEGNQRSNPLDKKKNQNRRIKSEALLCIQWFMTVFLAQTTKGKSEGHLILVGLKYIIIDLILTLTNSYFLRANLQAVQHGDGVVEVKMKKPNFTATPGQVML